MEIGEKIRCYRERHGLTQEDLAKALGTTPQNIYKYEKGIITNIPLDRIEKMAEVFDVSPSALTGWDDSSDPATDSVVMVPVAASVRAGFDDIAIELSGEYVPVPSYIVGSHAPGSLLAVRVAGQSMYPRLLDGDTVIIHKQDAVDSGDLAVLVYDGEECTIKTVLIRSDGVELVPGNPEYAPRHLDLTQARELRIVGKVIGLYRDMRG